MLAHFAVTIALILGCGARPLVTDLHPGNPLTLPIVKRLDLTNILKVIEADRARIKALFSQDVAYIASLTNAVVSYTAQVDIGDPALTYDLVVDSGSANTFVGSGSQKYRSTQTSVYSGVNMSVVYGSGFAGVGPVYFDTLRIGDLTVRKQAIGAADQAKGFEQVDGVLGIGPTLLTLDTIIGEPDTVVATVVDNALSEGITSSSVVGIYFQPPLTANDNNGEITFGGYDQSRINGGLNVIGFTKIAPASSYVGIDQSITYGTAGIKILNEAAGIVDSGTTLLLLNSVAFNNYQQATGAALDPTTGLLSLSAKDYDKLQSLYFKIGDTTYEFTRNAQIWPRALNEQIGGTDDRVYLVVNEAELPDGLSFINGQVFLERFFHAYDSTSKLFGIAPTAHTFATTN
ncbi:acid protease [Trametopsis cervina]|nr:acid protease [Trametopsis cervina]